MKSQNIVKPSISVSRLAEEAMERIGDNEEGVGVFLIGGKLLTVKVSSPAFEKQAQRFSECLVGVYNHLADFRTLRDDLRLYYA